VTINLNGAPQVFIDANNDTCVDAACGFNFNSR